MQHCMPREELLATAEAEQPRAQVVGWRTGPAVERDRPVCELTLNAGFRRLPQHHRSVKESSSVLVHMYADTLNAKQKESERNSVKQGHTQV